MAENIRKDDEQMNREEDLNRGTEQQGGVNRTGQPTQQPSGKVGDIQSQRRDIEEEDDVDVREGGQERKIA